MYKKIISLGITDDLEIVERNKVRTINTVALFLILTIVVSLIIYWYNDIPFVVYIYVFLYLLTSLIILTFNARKQYKVTDCTLNILFPIGHLLGVIPVGGQINHQLFFLISIVGTVYFTKHLSVKSRNLFAAYNIILFTLSSIYIYFRPYGFVKVDTNFAFQTNFINSLIILFALRGISNATYLFMVKLFDELGTMTKNQEQIIEKRTSEVRAYYERDVAKTRFFSNVSHELKTPLTLIISPIKRLLKNKNISKEDYYLMQSIEKNSLQLYDLTQQLLEFAKFEFDTVEVKNVNDNLEKSMRKLYEDFKSLATYKKIDFQFTYQGHSNLIIETDHYKLTTIVKNLLSNAIKYTIENDTITFGVTEFEDTLEITVEDTGSGIHKSDLLHIFDRYYQAQIMNSLVEGGTGIGLAICKEYAALLEGTITVKSVFGEGSKFTVTLPKKLAEKTSKPLLIPTSNNLNSLPLVIQDDTIKPHLPTILLVEDNMDLQQYIQLILRPSFNVIIANHGQEALNILKTESQNIRLIISDIMMPIMDGYEFLEQLKQLPDYVEIPVIMLTALSDMNNKIKALRYGIDDYIPKPFTDEELLVRIDNLLDNATQRMEYQQQEEELTPSPIKDAIIPATSDISYTDNSWLEELEQKVLENYSDYDFSVEQLAHLMAMSISSLFKKTKRIIGLTPMQYIKEVRLLEARKLLEIRKHTSVKEVVYSVGFKDVRNFSRNFKKRFGKKPSAYLE
ncbi:MAG: ATP-binding protein [Saprospiraceae bacterium]